MSSWVQYENVIDQPLFQDRVEAGRRLAASLKRFAGKNTIVLGIPRGGVPVAAEVADALGSELDVIVARKLGAPHSPELAIGAVTADGEAYLNAALLERLGVRDDYLRAVVDRESREALRREKLFRRGAPPARLTGRNVVLVDDGLATGATMRAAVRSVRRRAPAALVVAVPVGSAQACRSLADEADEVVCPYRPEPFFAVGEFYVRFESTEDAEVERLLREARARVAAPAHATRG